MGTVIVTGAASGIGRALAEAFADDGAHVVIADLDGAKADDVADAITRTRRGSAEAATLDVRDAAAVRELIEKIDADRRLDVLVNNAGIGVGGPITELTPEHFSHILDVNVMGVVHGCVAAMPLMIARQRGQILNTASMAGLIPAPGLSPYAMSKHAVVGLTLSLRAEGATAGVKVSALCPGWVDTPILDQQNPVGLEVEGTGAGVRPILDLFGPQKPITTQEVAAATLRGLRRNDALIVLPREARIAWRAQRFTPLVVEQGAQKSAAALRRYFEQQRA